MRYRLRTLMILLGIAPPLAGLAYREYERRRMDADQQTEVDLILAQLVSDSRHTTSLRVSLLNELKDPPNLEACDEAQVSELASLSDD
jgi:hypothetical protein